MDSSYYRSVRPQQYQQGNPHFFSNYYRDRPPGPFRNYNSQPPPPQPLFQQQHRRPNFVVQLVLSKPAQRRTEAGALISKLKCKPERFQIFDRGYVAGSLFYEQWVEALGTMVQLWEIRLNDGHLFTPRLKQHVKVSSDNDELRDHLKLLFLAKLKGLFDGELVQKWQKKMEAVRDELKGVTGVLKGRNNLKVYNDLVKKRDGLEKEISLILKRIEEFKNGVQGLVDYLEGKVDEEQQDIGVKIGVYKLGREFNWEVIHSIITRECRRLDEGLPIFAFRRDILERIHYQQVD